MHTTTTEQLSQEKLERAVASRVVLRSRGGDTAGFFVSAEGHIVASLHAVSGEDEITAITPEGWELPVTGVTAVDPRRDLALLKVDGMGFPVLPLATPAAASEGEPVFAFNSVNGQTPTSQQVGTVHVLDSELQIFELLGVLPTESTGSPVLNAQGEGVGFVTAGRGAVGSTSVAVPLKHVVRLIESGPGRPLKTLQSAGSRRQVQRDVPNHPVEMLRECEPSAVQEIVLALARAIQAGAPLYNQGDVSACVRIYQNAATRLCEEHSNDCASVVAALRVGLTRAATLELAEQKAWALRDAFDGVLDVARRYFHAQQVPTRPTVGGSKKFVN